MTSKGQVTIPLELRERYGLGAGADVEVIATEDGALVRPAPTRSQGNELSRRCATALTAAWSRRRAGPHPLG